MDMMTEYRAFVASLTYGEEPVPMTVADAEYTLQQWKEEGSIEPPPGFTAEIYADLWNAWCTAQDGGKASSGTRSDLIVIRDYDGGIETVSGPYKACNFHCLNQSFPARTAPTVTYIVITPEGKLDFLTVSMTHSIEVSAN